MNMIEKHGDKFFWAEESSADKRIRFRCWMLHVCLLLLLILLKVTIGHWLSFKFPLNLFEIPITFSVFYYMGSSIARIAGGYPLPRLSAWIIKKFEPKPQPVPAKTQKAVPKQRA